MFRRTFKQFDKDNSSTLEPHEVKAALSAMDVDKSDAEIGAIIKEYDKTASGKLLFDDFVSLMVHLTEDQDSSQQIVAAFRTLAGDKPTVTETQIRSVFPPDTANYLLSAIPKSSDGSYDYPAWIKTAYGETTK